MYRYFNIMDGKQQIELVNILREIHENNPQELFYILAESFVSDSMAEVISNAEKVGKNSFFIREDIFENVPFDKKNISLLGIFLFSLIGQSDNDSFHINRAIHIFESLAHIMHIEINPELAKRISTQFFQKKEEEREAVIEKIREKNFKRFGKVYKALA